MKACIIFTLGGCLAIGTVFSQPKIRYKPVSVLLALGRSSQHAEGTIMSFETAGQFRNNRIGVRLEGAVTGMKMLSSTMLTYDRYFFDNDFVRFSAGAGMGHFRSDERGACSAGPGTVNTRHDMKHLGGMMRVGITFSHFKLGAEYNLIAPTIASAVDLEGKTTGRVSYANSYFGFKFGFVIGGGRRSTVGQ
jgi:hypothetical protein